MYFNKLACLRVFLLFFVSIAASITPSYSTELIDGWVESNNIEVVWSNPSRSRRSPDATVDVAFINNGSDAIAGPLRFVIQSLTPANVSLTNADGTMVGYQYFTLIAEGNELAAGASANISKMAIAGGGSTIFQMSGAVFSAVAEVDILVVDITSPETLLTVGYSPYQVSGTINNSTAELTLNGVPVTHQGGTFTAQVELTEGFNTVVARVTTVEGEQVTDSIVLSLDLTPPYLTVESHTEAQTVYTDKITVTGLINDIVRGTVEAEQAQVQVNGVTASVSNRSYAAHNIPLTEGENTITISGVDQVGNSASIVRKVIYKVISGSKLELVSGQNQQALIASQLPKALRVQLVNELGTGIADETVIFRVTQGAGMVGVGTPELGRAVIVTTDVSGFAETSFLVGPRSGVANHKVKAKVVGYENEIIFTASANSVTGDKVSINSGNNQRGIVGQTLPAPFIVAVTDHGANTVKGARIRFDIIEGEGLFQNEETSYETITDTDGRAIAQLTLGPLTGIDAQRVEAILLDGPDGIELMAGFSATAFIAADPGNTSLSGVVLNNQDDPIPGVTVYIEDTDRTALTNQEGRFKIEQAPVGPVHIIVDGSTATLAGEYPSLSYHLVTVAGVENPMSAPVYMVKLDTENGVLAGKEDVVLTLDNFPGFKLEIAKDSVTFPDGSREGIISVTSVNASKVPMAPPNGMQPQFIVTIQPVGTTFSPAAKVTLPNVDGHLPGAQVEMYSFDHDLEEFVSVGLGSVSEDGSVVSSNPGVGVIKAGWYCGSQPSGSGTAHNCPECQKCTGSACRRDASQNNNERAYQEIGDCSTSLCKGNEADDNDITEEDKKCNTCSDGKKIEDKDKENKSCDISGDDSKACWICQSGNCGPPKCNADTATTNLAKSFMASPIDKVKSKLKKGLDKIFKGRLSADVKFDLKAKYVNGRTCCNDCTVEPSSDELEHGFKYDEFNGAIGGDFNLSFGLDPDEKEGLVFREPVGGEFRIVLGITSTPAITVDIKATGNGTGRKIEHCPDDTCGKIEADLVVTLSGNAGLGLAANIGEYMVNDTLGCPKYRGKFRVNKEVCWKVTVGGKGEANTKIEGDLIRSSIKGTFPLPDSKCVSEDYSCNYSAGRTDLVTNGGVSFTFPLPFGLTVEKDVKLNSVKINLFEGITGDCGI